MNDTDALQELLSRWQKHREQGADLAVEDLCVENPELTPVLRERIAAIIASEAGADSVSQLLTPRICAEEDSAATTKRGIHTPARLKVHCPTCNEWIAIAVDSCAARCAGCGCTIHLRGAPFDGKSEGVKRLGKFELLEHLGIGGFGAVWKARDTELDRIVALKIPHTGLRTDREELERFQREARAAANLRHPNIVCIHEVANLDGLPVIVAEFVPGVPLKDLLDASQRLTFRQAAAFVAEVGDALEYAHCLGVVHRDVKPANIIVSRVAASSDSVSADKVRRELAGIGKPILLDFGLALRDAVETTMTIDGHVLGTPAYMSPEQAAGQSHQADRRSDVYSLGVILYQLLTGELPFRGSRSMVIFQVLHDEPAPPRKINDRIPRDLETICLKCLAKSPACRYGSARELADDLRRYLAGEPIQARPVSTMERVGRWCRRKPALATASGAAILGVLVALVTMTVAFVVVSAARDNAEILNEDLIKANFKHQQARKDAEAQEVLTSNQRKAADEQRLRAELEAEKAKSISEYLVGMFESSDPLGLSGFSYTIPKVTGEKLTAREVLDRAAARIQTDKSMKPLVRAAVLDSIGNVYRSLGQYKQAEPHLQSALKIRQETPGADPLDLAASLHNIGWLHHERGNYEHALSLYRQALKIRQEQPTPDEKLVGASQLNQAWLLTEMRRHREAEDILKEIIDRRKAYWGDDHRETALARLALATVYFDSQRFVDALPIAQKGIEPLLRAEGNDTIAAAIGKFQESILQTLLKNHAGAEKNLIESLAHTRNAMGQRHIYSAFVQYHLAANRIAQNKWDEAEADLLDCISIGREQVGLAHPKVRLVVNTLAALQSKRGNTKDGSALFEELLQAQIERFGPESVLVGESLLDYATHLERANLPAERLRALEQAAAIFRKSKDANDLLVKSLNRLGTAHFNALRFDEAEVVFREASNCDPQHALAWQNLGNALQRLGRFEESITATEESLSLRKVNNDARQKAEKQLTKSRELLELDKRLPIVLGQTEKADSAELLACADLCKHYKHRYRTAVQLYEAAFKLNPKVADQIRFDAACAAVLAAFGQGKETTTLEASEQARLLNQARKWLEMNLDIFRRRTEGNQYTLLVQVTQRLPHWQTAPAFATVREPDLLAKLGASESADWLQFWSQVDHVYTKAESRFEVVRIDGVLSPNEKSKTHEIAMKAGMSYVIDLQSSQFDTQLKLQYANGTPITENDDISKQNLNSRLVFPATSDGTYRIVATSYQGSGVGAYSLQIKTLRPLD